MTANVVVDRYDGLDGGGLMTGPITSEAPQRGYVAEYGRLMRTAVPSHAG